MLLTHCRLLVISSDLHSNKSQSGQIRLCVSIQFQDSMVVQQLAFVGWVAATQVRYSWTVTRKHNMEELTFHSHGVLCPWQSIKQCSRMPLAHV